MWIYDCLLQDKYVLKVKAYELAALALKREYDWFTIWIYVQVEHNDMYEVN